MQSLPDKENLLQRQYKTSENLEKRIAIYNYRTNPQDLFQWAFELYDFQAESKILEVGCGNGRFWRVNYSNIDPSLGIHLSDASKGMLESAQVNLGSHFHYSIADVESLPFPDQEFDYVLSHFMLYYCADLNRALNELRRVCKPGGTIGILTNSTAHLSQIIHPPALEQKYQLSTKLMHPAKREAWFGESKADQVLSDYFSLIKKYQFKDVLKIPKTKYLVDYISSMERYQEFFQTHPDFLRDYKRCIKAEINQNGYYGVDTSSSLYLLENRAPN